MNHDTKEADKSIKKYKAKIKKLMNGSLVTYQDNIELVDTLAYLFYRRDCLINEIFKYGDVVIAPNGMLKSNPAAKSLNDNLTLILRTMAALGLTPQARKNMGETGGSFQEILNALK